MILLLLVGSLSIAGALESVTLAWDASSGGNVSGYKVYYGTASGSLSQSLDVGNVTSAIVSNLNPATKYFFSVSAYNAAGLKSVPSNEVSHTTGTDLYALSVVNGNGDGNYGAGAQVLVSANAPQQGSAFARWNGDYVILVNRLLSTTRATIPFRDVEVTANYTTMPSAPVGPEELGTGLLGQYYNDGSGAVYPLANPFKGTPALTRTDAKIDFTWGWAMPGAPVSAADFSIGWSFQVENARLRQLHRQSYRR